MKYTPKITQQTDIYTVVRFGRVSDDNRYTRYNVTLQNPKMENTFDKYVPEEFLDTLYKGKEIEMTLDFNEFGEPVDLLRKSEYESSYRIDVVLSTFSIIAQVILFLGILGI